MEEIEVGQPSSSFWVELYGWIWTTTDWIEKQKQKASALKNDQGKEIAAVDADR